MPTAMHISRHWSAATAAVAPEKVTISGHRNVKAGETITLSCVSAISNPPAVLTWFTRGRHLSGSTSNVMPSAQVASIPLYSVSVNAVLLLLCIPCFCHKYTKAMTPILGATAPRMH